MNILKTPGKAFSAVIKNPVFQTVFPVFAVGNLLAQAASSKLLNTVTNAGRSQVQTPTSYGQDPGQGQYYQAPPQYVNYQTSPSGSYLQQDYAQPQSFQGGSPWDYSTSQPIYFQTQPTTYSDPSQGGQIWEDLLTVGAFFL